MIVCIQGPTGTLKTSLALTFPLGIQHFELDIGGFDRAKRHFKDEIAAGKIRSKKYQLPERAIDIKLDYTGVSKIIGVKELMKEILEDYQKALNNTEINTIVIDTLNLFSDIAMMAQLQEKQEDKPSREQLIQIEYSEINTRIRAMIYQARKAEKNLVFVAPIQDNFVKKLIGGEIKDYVDGTKHMGWKHMPENMDFIIEMSVEVKRLSSGAVVIPKSEVLKSAVGLELVGDKAEWKDWRESGGSPNWGYFQSMIEALQ